VLKANKVQKAEIKHGDMNMLRKVVDENILFYYEQIVKRKEDTQLYQGYLQTLLDIKEAISPV